MSGNYDPSPKQGLLWPCVTSALVGLIMALFEPSNANAQRLLGIFVFTTSVVVVSCVLRSGHGRPAVKE
jgi:hypothetical protein